MPIVDFAVFNELSGKQPAPELRVALNWIRDLVDTLKAASLVGFRRLRTRHDFRATNLTQEFPFDVILRQLDRDRRVFLLTALDSPYLQRDQEEAFLARSISAIDGRTCNQAEGILSAYVAGTLAVSFPSHDQWAVSQLRVSVTLDEDDAVEDVVVPHASRSEHLSQHVVWASRVTVDPALRLVPRHDQPLPNTVMSDLLVID
jgi:hypothetical protein